MRYQDQEKEYKLVQIRLHRSKHALIIKWLEDSCNKEESSLNSEIIKILKEKIYSLEK